MRKKILIITCVLVLFTLISCSRRNAYYDYLDVKTYGDFLYTNKNIDGGLSIIGLTKEGKEKEVIVFPAYIEGKPVVCLGSHVNYEAYGEIDTRLVRKIYFPSTYKYHYVDLKLSSNNTAIFYGGESWFFINFVNVGTNTFLSNNSKSFYDSIRYSEPTESKLKISTVEYHMEEKTYFVDNVESGKIEVVPPTPYKDELVFDGWYIGDTKWDFDTMKVEDYFNDQNRLILEAKWK